VGSSPTRPTTADLPIAPLTCGFVVRGARALSGGVRLRPVFSGGLCQMRAKAQSASEHTVSAWRVVRARRDRRLARDYETLPASSESMIHIASIDNLTKRITDETTPTWRGIY
jgi:hypothetical protein